ncbi:MAG: DUF1353 domain-containing protein [Hyphomicrobium sp.]|nr:DUF1353 domain-containing protein [Hyphomicrobium sp.]
MKLAVLALAALALPAACTEALYGRVYDQTEAGQLKGRLVVEWIDQDKFVFTPDPANPLRYTRKNSDVIEPQRMVTDGGTIPPPLRAVKSYSPWGYAPAFIIHDWLFAMKHCKVPGFEAYDVDKAATVMAEVLKTLMQDPRYGGPNKLVHYSMYEAVRSATAQDYWNNGTCDTAGIPKTANRPMARSRQLPPADAPAAPGAAPPTASGTPANPKFTIEF